MKESENINDWIRRQVEDNPEQPPESAWQQISENLELETAWQGINQDLELDNLWNTIDNRVQVHGQMLWWNRVGAGVASAAIVIITGLFLLHSLPDNTGNIENQGIATVVQQTEESTAGAKVPIDAPEEKIPSTKPAAKAKTSTTSASLDQNRTTGKGYTDLTQQFVSGSSVASSLQGIGNERTNVAVYRNTISSAVIEEVQNKPSALLQQHHLKRKAMLSSEAIWDSTDIEKVVLFVNEDDQPVPALAIEKEKLPSRKQWRVGLGASARISGLINQKTIQALEKSSLTTSVPAFGKSFYLSVERNISPRLSLLSDVVLYSESGQRYQEYYGGVYGTTHTNLKYSQLNVMLAYNKKGLEDKRFAYRRWLTGIAAGWLHQAQLSGPLGTTDISQDYKNFSAALLLGFDYNYPVGDRMWLNCGIKGQIDMLDIYKGTSNRQSELRNTHTALLDFTFGFKYNLMK